MLRKKTWAFSLLAILIGFFLFSSGYVNRRVDASGKTAKASPTAHCYCKAIVYVGDDAGSSISNPIIDLGQVATYNTQLGHDKDCESACSAAAAQNPNFNNKTWLCQQLGCSPGQHRVSAYAAVGTRNYRVAQSIFFTCSGNVTTCTCPHGWAANSTNVDGGVTSDGMCKKMACQPIGISPPPANGTQVGTWGFTWGNALYAWGTSANGGAPNCVTSPCVGH